MSHVMTATITPTLTGLFAKVKALKASNIGAGPTIEARDDQGIVYHFGVHEGNRSFPINLHFAGMIFKRGAEIFLWFRQDLEALGTRTVPAHRLHEGLCLTAAA